MQYILVYRDLYDEALAPEKHRFFEAKSDEDAKRDVQASLDSGGRLYRVERV